MSQHDTELGTWIPGSSPEESPGVLMIPDVWGLADHYRNLGARLAAEGFSVLVIDPYRKTGYPEISSPAEAMAWIAELDDNVMLETLSEGVSFLGERCMRVGITGFCMGGQYAVLAGCSLEGLSACAPFYGMLRYPTDRDRSKKPRSPLDASRDLSCPLFGFYGEEDAIIPVDDVWALEAALSAVPHSASIELYAGAGHAFMNDTRPEAYREAAAADAWPKLISFLSRELAAS